MSKLVSSLVVAAVLGLAGSALAKEAKATLKVDGWHCGGCSAKTEEAVKKVEGVTAVTADVDAKTLSVTFDDAKTNVTKVEAAVASSGYKVVKK